MKRFGAAALTALTVVLLWGAESRRKVWDLDLSIFVNHQADIASQVWGIRFSPDETKVAIGFRPRWNFDPHPRHVVVVALDHPQTALRDFELDPPAAPLPSDRAIAWSPSATILVAAILPKPLMLRFNGEAPCVFPEDSTFGGFLSGDRMAVSVRRPSPKNTPTEIQILNPDCSLADSWSINGLADLNDTSPEQDLLAIATRQKPPENPVIELVAPQTHTTKQRLIGAFAGGLVFSDLVFSDHALLLCGAKHREGKSPLPDVACWDTQSGEKTSENQGVSLAMWGPTVTSGGNLLAMTDYRYISREGSFWQFLDMFSDWVPKRALIWNARTGKEVASWGARQQKELRGKNINSAQTRKNNFVLSLSPSGKYVAEGGSGSISVYAVQP
jgi:hypothetical protein